MLSKRVQVLLEQEEFKKLKKIGERTHKSLGELFREAIRLYGERLTSKIERLEVVKKITGLKIPTASWNRIEKQIARAHLKGIF